MGRDSAITNIKGRESAVSTDDSVVTQEIHVPQTQSSTQIANSGSSSTIATNIVVQSTKSSTSAPQAIQKASQIQQSVLSGSSKTGKVPKGSATVSHGAATGNGPNQKNKGMVRTVPAKTVAGVVATSQTQGKKGNKIVAQERVSRGEYSDIQHGYNNQREYNEKQEKDEIYKKRLT
jgi:hypothetical protein